MYRQRILIVSGSYIVRHGLKSLLEEVGTEVFFSEDKNIPVPVPADVIFLDQSIAQPAEIEKQMEEVPLFERPEIILLTWSNAKNHPGHPRQFDLSLSKSQLLHQLESFLDILARSSPNTDQGGPLSSREINILRLIALGNTNKEIAGKLYISTHTVITHRKNITRKLGIKTVSGLTVYAILNNIIHLEDLQST